MYFSAKIPAALAVALFCTHSIASSVKAAPVPMDSLGHVANGADIDNDIASTDGALRQKREPDDRCRGLAMASQWCQGMSRKREPEPLNLGGIIKEGEKVLHDVLKREPQKKYCLGTDCMRPPTSTFQLQKVNA